MPRELTDESLTDRLNGHGVVALAPTTMTELGVETGAFVGLNHGEAQATAAVQPAVTNDSTDFVALSTHLQTGLGVGPGDTVTVATLNVDTAHRVEVDEKL